MVKVENFSIVLQKEMPVYHPGDCVTGQVEIKVEECFKCNSIRFVAKGYVFVDM